MGLSRYEKEVVICLNADGGTAILYTSDPMWIRKMDRLAKRFPDVFRVRRQTKISKSYELPKHLVGIKPPA